MSFRHWTFISWAIALVTLDISGASAQEVNGHKAPEAAANGSASSMELDTFGEYLEAGRSAPVRDGLNKLMLATVTASYHISGQFKEELRLCKYRESIAENEAERTQARECRLGALTNLGRFSEAEELAYNDNKWSPQASSPNGISDIKRWLLLARLSLNQGNIQAASTAFQRTLQLITAEKSKTVPKAPPEQELAGLQESLTDSWLRDWEISCLNSLARIDFELQNFDRYQARVAALLALLTSSESNVRDALTMDHVDLLVAIGKRSVAVALAASALPALKADAGFRDQAEPLQSFEVLPSAAAALGDEKINRLFVTAWLRLAKAYALTGREEEARRLFTETLRLSKQYILEPVNSSTLVAAVEEAIADQAVHRRDYSAATALLKSARQRLVTASLAERSSSFGRRHLEFNSPLLSVNAKLLAMLTRTSAMPIRDPWVAGEIMQIASDFSASRADTNVRHASMTLRETRPELKALLEREGALVDDLVELRGELSSLTLGKPSPSATSSRGPILQAQLSNLLAELHVLKQQMSSDDTFAGLDNSERWRRFSSRLQTREAYWQWIVHPTGNVTICVTSSGVWLVPLGMSAGKMKALADELHQKSSLRGIKSPKQIKPYPIAKAHSLYENLFAPLAGQMRGKDHWILSPPGLLDAVPWPALVTKPPVSLPQRPAWLVERAAISLIPSWQAWQELQQRGASRASRSFLGVGDPRNKGAISTAALKIKGSFVSGIAPEATVAPDSDTSFAHELTVISKLFPAGSRKILSGNRATKKALLQLPLNRYRIIVFSTHGYLAGEMYQTIGPSLALTGTGTRPSDRFLSANEIAHLRLDAELVFLSACDTAAPDGHLDAEGFSGLTSAFLLAGARNVVATLWPVETEATERLAISTLSNYVNGRDISVSFALRSAMMDALRSTDKLRSHPSFWAGFLVVGN